MRALTKMLASRTARSTTLFVAGLTRAVLGFVGEAIGLGLGQLAGSAAQGIEEVQARRPLHLFQSLNRHHRRKRFSFALDNKVVVTQRHAVKDVAQALPDVEGCEFLGHVVISRNGQKL
jgi:hypothetical protein